LYLPKLNVVSGNLIGIILISSCPQAYNCILFGNSSVKYMINGFQKDNYTAQVINKTHLLNISISIFFVSLVVSITVVVIVFVVLIYFYHVHFSIKPQVYGLQKWIITVHIHFHHFIFVLINYFIQGCLLVPGASHNVFVIWWNVTTQHGGGFLRNKYGCTVRGAPSI